MLHSVLIFYSKMGQADLLVHFSIHAIAKLCWKGIRWLLNSEKFIIRKDINHQMRKNYSKKDNHAIFSRVKFKDWSYRYNMIFCCTRTCTDPIPDRLLFIFLSFHKKIDRKFKILYFIKSCDFKLQQITLCSKNALLLTYYTYQSF